MERKQLQTELLDIEKLIKDIFESFEASDKPDNVLWFDQSKRRKPLIDRVYDRPAEVIDLNHFRLHREVKKVA